MLGLDWYDVNSNRRYPFQPSDTDAGLRTNEILDCRFFLVNPSSTNVTIYLYSREEYSGYRKYTFKNSLGDSLDFTVPDCNTWQCVWNTDEDNWYGFCIFGPSEE